VLSIGEGTVQTSKQVMVVGLHLFSYGRPGI
jgi:hypothetical protein